MKWFLLSAILAGTVNAATVAVIDSGLDYKHEMIVPNLWVNPNEVFDRRDNDGNGYQDDVHGWNFAEQNGQIIDYKYLGTFSEDPKKFFEIQGRSFLGQATEADKAWVEAKRKDPKFLAEMGKFGNFVHGTHVAGVAAMAGAERVMGIKLLPTEFKPFFERLSTSKSVDRWGLLARGFETLAAQQMQLLAEIGRFVNSHGAAVANGSFGTGFNQAKMISDVAYRILFFKKPSEEDSKKAAKLFLTALIKHGEAFVAAAPNTLFVFAAGNDGLSNDEFGTSPANIKADNVISVGATYKSEFFAPFSNFGTKSVDIAAPGMLIGSAIPGNEYLEVSGTSQAAPYIAGVAAGIKDSNPSLRPAEIKEILLQTVDRKSFLKGKVATEGIVNSERAMMAAELSKTMSIAEAILQARRVVRPSAEDHTPAINFKAIIPIPLSPVFH